VTLDFFSAKRGETPTPALAAAGDEAVPVGNPVDLAVEHTRALEGLGGGMKTVSGVLLAVGALDLLTGLLIVGETPTTGLLSVVEGIALAAWGAVLMAPTKAITALLGASPRNVGFVMKLCNSFLSTFKAYLLILVVLTVVVVCRLVFTAM
jgi:hypothetical protein